MQPEVSSKVDGLASEIASRTSLVGDCPAVRTRLQVLATLFNRKVAAPIQLAGLVLGLFLVTFIAVLLAVPAYMLAVADGTLAGQLVVWVLWFVLSFASWRLLVRGIVFKVGGREITSFFRICANAGLTHR